MGRSGSDGFENRLADVGYQHADMLTYVAVGARVGAGVLLVLGLFTPLAAAAALAYLINSLLWRRWRPRPHGYLPYFLPDGHEYQVMHDRRGRRDDAGRTRAATGFDAGRGWARRPFIGSFAALLVGIGAGVGRVDVPERRQPAGS